jgi:endonuclease/exonuclease/phosphatase family metal-dependent hydrolase
MHGPIKQWGSAIFSPRFPLEPWRPPPSSNLRAFGGYLAFGAAELPDGSETVLVSVHARDAAASAQQLEGIPRGDAKRPSVRQPRVNDAIFCGLANELPDRFLAAGDWNTGRAQASPSAGVEFFDRAEASGWFDCVARFGAGEMRTWFGRGRKLIQNDHVFCDTRLGKRLRSVSVADEAAVELGLSDHAPLIVDFRMEPIGMTANSR